MARALRDYVLVAISSIMLAGPTPMGYAQAGPPQAAPDTQQTQPEQADGNSPPESRQAGDPTPTLIRRMRSTPATNFTLSWRPDRLADQIPNLPYPHRSLAYLVQHPTLLTRRARRQCPEAKHNDSNPALRGALQGVNARDWYCLQKPDSTDGAWSLQGISGSEDARPSGVVQGENPILMAWYHKGPNAPDRSRLTLLVPCSTGQHCQARYVHIELMQVTGTAAHPTLSPLAFHAGGVVWRGNHIYVAAPSRGLRVFSTNNLLDTTGSGVASTRFVLPESGLWRSHGDSPTPPTTCNRDGNPCYDYVALDRSATTEQFLTGEYCAGSASGGNPTLPCRSRIARWNFNDLENRQTQHPIHARRAYLQPTSSVQGGISYRPPDTGAYRCYHFSASRGRNGRGWIVNARPNHQTRSIRGARGTQDLYLWRHRRQLWSVTEWPRPNNANDTEKRVLYGFNLNQVGCP